MDRLSRWIGSLVGVLVLFAVLGYVSTVGLAQWFAPDKTGVSGEECNGDEDAEESPEGIPEDESIWEDYPKEDLDNEERLKERPGNFEVITLVGKFYQGMYQIEPTFENLAFPFQLETEVLESREVVENESTKWEAEMRAKGRKKKNKLRQYNVIFEEIEFLNFKPNESAIPNPAERGIAMRMVDTFGEVRKRHPERCVLVLCDMRLESLQSPKIEENPDGVDEILCFVLKEDGWKLVWFDK